MQGNCRALRAPQGELLKLSVHNARNLNSVESEKPMESIFLCEVTQR
jgi:hypothetical protein